MQSKLLVDASIQLRRALASVSAGNSGLCPFTGFPEMAYGFFPGGNGLYNGIHSESRVGSGTLILGSNFGCKREFVDEQGIRDAMIQVADWSEVHQVISDDGLAPEFREMLKQHKVDLLLAS